MNGDLQVVLRVERGVMADRSDGAAIVDEIEQRRAVIAENPEVIERIPLVVAYGRAEQHGGIGGDR